MKQPLLQSTHNTSNGSCGVSCGHCEVATTAVRTRKCSGGRHTHPQARARADALQYHGFYHSTPRDVPSASIPVCRAPLLEPANVQVPRRNTGRAQGLSLHCLQHDSHPQCAHQKPDGNAVNPRNSHTGPRPSPSSCTRVQAAVGPRAGRRGKKDSALVARRAEGTALTTAVACVPLAT